MSAMGSMAQGARQYRVTATTAAIHGADPHALITLLFNGALEHIERARGQMERHEIAAKGISIGRAMDIVGGLQGGLDFERGGELSVRLESLYDYMVRRLLVANVSNDPAVLDEVAGLLKDLRSAWEAIRSQVV